jgi:hypothetical protein
VRRRKLYAYIGETSSSSSSGSSSNGSSSGAVSSAHTYETVRQGVLSHAITAASTGADALTAADLLVCSVKISYGKGQYLHFSTIVLAL